MNLPLPLALSATPGMQHRYCMNLHLCLTSDPPPPAPPLVSEAPVPIRSLTVRIYMNLLPPLDTGATTPSLTRHHCYVMSPSAGLATGDLPFLSPADTICPLHGMHDPSPELQCIPLVKQSRSCMNLMTTNWGTSHPHSNHLSR